MKCWALKLILSFRRIQYMKLPIFVQINSFTNRKFRTGFVDNIDACKKKKKPSIFQLPKDINY